MEETVIIVQEEIIDRLTNELDSSYFTLRDTIQGIRSTDLIDAKHVDVTSVRLNVNAIKGVLSEIIRTMK